MKIIHTSDWHLGKNLEENSRIDEQKLFLEEFLQITKKNEVDLIIIAGDIYDTSNPPFNAEELFYEYMDKLCENGKRPIIIISGNHDSPNRLTASSPLALSKGIIVVGTLETVIPTKKHNEFEIMESGSGFIKLKIKDEKICIINMPYPSEKRINEIISSGESENEMQKSYSDKVSQIYFELEKNFENDSINIATGHFYVSEGESTNSERNIQLGGAYAVNGEDLPKKAQYIALGHLHKSQKAAKTKNAFYSGSPIQYSKGEANGAKSIYLVEIQANKDYKQEKIYLSNYKPIEIWKTKSVEETIQMCKKNSSNNSWVFIEIETNRTLTLSEMKEMRKLKNDIIEIKPILINESSNAAISFFEDETLNESFENFYLEIKGAKPEKHIINLFEEILSSENLDKNDVGF